MSQKQIFHLYFSLPVKKFVGTLPNNGKKYVLQLADNSGEYVGSTFEVSTTGPDPTILYSILDVEVEILELTILAGTLRVKLVDEDGNPAPGSGFISAYALHPYLENYMNDGLAAPGIYQAHSFPLGSPSTNYMGLAMHVMVDPIPGPPSPDPPEPEPEEKHYGCAVNILKEESIETGRDNLKLQLQATKRYLFPDENKKRKKVDHTHGVIEDTQTVTAQQISERTQQEEQKEVNGDVFFGPNLPNMAYAVSENKYVTFTPDGMLKGADQPEPDYISGKLIVERTEDMYITEDGSIFPAVSVFDDSYSVISGDLVNYIVSFFTLDPDYKPPRYRQYLDNKNKILSTRSMNNKYLALLQKHPKAKTDPAMIQAIERLSALSTGLKATVQGLNPWQEKNQFNLIAPHNIYEPINNIEKLIQTDDPQLKAHLIQFFQAQINDPERSKVFMDIVSQIDSIDKTLYQKFQDILMQGAQYGIGALQVGLTGLITHYLQDFSYHSRMQDAIGLLQENRDELYNNPDDVTLARRLYRDFSRGILSQQNLQAAGDLLTSYGIQLPVVNNYMGLKTLLTMGTLLTAGYTALNTKLHNDNAYKAYSTFVVIKSVLQPETDYEHRIRNALKEYLQDNHIVNFRSTSAQLDYQNINDSLAIFSERERLLHFIDEISHGVENKEKFQIGIYRESPKQNSFSIVQLHQNTHLPQKAKRSFKYNQLPSSKTLGYTPETGRFDYLMRHADKNFMPQTGYPQFMYAYMQGGQRQMTEEEKQTEQNRWETRGSFDRMRGLPRRTDVPPEYQQYYNRGYDSYQENYNRILQQSQQPQIRPQAPQIRPQAPQIRPQAPQIRPQAPQIRPQAPQIRPQAPQIRPQAPQIRPQRRPQGPRQIQNIRAQLPNQPANYYRNNALIIAPPIIGSGLIIRQQGRGRGRGRNRDDDEDNDDDRDREVDSDSDSDEYEDDEEDDHGFARMMQNRQLINRVNFGYPKYKCHWKQYKRQDGRYVYKYVCED